MSKSQQAADRDSIIQAVKNPPLQAKPLMLLMSVIVISAIPHFLRIPVLLSAVIGGALGIKLLMLWRGRMAASRVLLVLLTVGTTALVFLNYGTINGHEAGSALLLGMLALKLLEAKNYRDAMICVFLAYFLTAVNFLFTQSIPTAIWMVIQVVLITYCLISVNQSKLNVPGKFRAQFAIKTVLQALPIMVIMFLLFPRIPGPLWGIPKASGSASTGFSESMSPGRFSGLAKSGAVAFRVDFDHQIPPKLLLYWRALVLWHYDGFTWNKGKSIPSRAQKFDKAGPVYEYTVTIEPHNNKALFTLDMPDAFENAEVLDRNYQLSAQRKITQVSQYRVSSYIDYTINPQLEAFEWRKGLQLPDGYNPRTIALGKRWREELDDPQAVINQALIHFNSEEFYYTLDPPSLGKHKADDFLFNTRSGFCEYYASTFVILMRAAGIPARVVVGYQGGETNPINNNLTVRQSDAHAWAEVWLPEKGWVRVDPTAAVAPERVEENLDAALPEEDRGSVPFTVKASALKGLINLWDAIDNGWNQWVLGYGPDFQKQFLGRFGLKDFMHFTYAMVALIGIVLAIISFMMLRPAKTAKLSEAQKIYRQFCRKMARKGYPKHDYETATDYVKRLVQLMPEKSRELKGIAQNYNRLEYQGPSRALLEEFQQLVKNFKPEIKLQTAKSN